MVMFDEYDDIARKIMLAVIELVEEIEHDANVSFKAPPHDIARRFLNEIQEFKSLLG